MKLVIVESPYSGDIGRNVAYARRALRDCIIRNESPIASHLLLTQPGVLDDSDKYERALGIDAGHAWLRVADAVVVYQDYGISEGMSLGIERAETIGVTVKYRSIGQ